MPSPFCHTPDCDNPVENRDTGLCSSCSRKSRKEEELALAEPKKRKPIKKVAEKRAKQLTQYSRLKAQYIAIHQICEVPTCNKQAVDIHHQRSRTNENLLDTNYWMSICRQHHIYYTENSKEAIENGYSYIRTGNLEKD